jgi:Zn-dependent M16 (insulinase) family peptidase
VFSVGLQGIANEDTDKVLAVIDETLRRIAVDGFEQSRIDAIFHQIELSLKHVTKHFGLNLMMRMMPYFRDRVSVLTPLHVSKQIELIREQLAAGPFFQKLIEKNLLQNEHRVVLEMHPDPEFNAKEIAAERAKLDAVQASLDETTKQSIVDDAVALSARQEEEQNSDVLPSLSVSDIDPIAKRVDLTYDHMYKSLPTMSDNATPVASLVQPTNGVAYMRAISSLAALPAHLLPYLPLFTSYIAATGAASMSYKALSDAVDLFTGGVSASAQIDSNVDDIDQCNLSFVFSSRALERNISKMLELSSHVLSDPSFSDVERLRQLLSNNALDLSMSLQDTGHTFARLDASQHLTPNRALAEQLGGITSVKFVNALVTPEDGDVDGKISDARVLAVGERLREIAAFVLRGAADTNDNKDVDSVQQRRELDRYMIVGDDACLSTLRSQLPDFLAPTTSTTTTLNSDTATPATFPVDFAPLSSGASAPRRFFALPIAVNYLAQCVRTVPYTHVDSPALAVAAQLMSSIFLHREIRERGGAYGGGCSLDALSGVFSFYSYRDPGCIKTVAAFRASVDWISDESNYTDREVDEALLSIFAAIDAPTSPSQKGVGEFVTGITHEMRQSRRDAYLRVTRADLSRVVGTWMSMDVLDASPITCVGNGSAVPAGVSAEGSGWTIDTLSL